MGSISRFRRSKAKDVDGTKEAEAATPAEKAPQPYVARQGKANGEPAKERRTPASVKR